MLGHSNCPVESECLSLIWTDTDSPHSACKAGCILLQPRPRGFRIGSIVGKLVCGYRCRAASEHAEASVRKHGVACYADFELQGLQTALNQFELK